ncbi:MAG: alpha/beta hydrolase [Robiginitomaculum sp.]|nr:alpha/beta hydrolase [Robiginitomaculum sp.]
MARIKLRGKLHHIIRSYMVISTISMSVLWRRLLRKPLVPDWSFEFEIGVLFWRHQFNRAFALPDIREGRAYMDSLVTLTDETYDLRVTASRQGEPKGKWLVPQNCDPEVTALYLHGGGYTFNSEISANFAKTLASLLNIKLFMLDYRLTPENPHPAQIEDALEAYNFLLKKGVGPNKLIVIGDSAGGHLALMLLIALRDLELPQPALAIGLCPWTDIGERGDSLDANDRYDLVQGYMAVRFGEWLRGNSEFTNEELSPIHQDFSGLAPIYMQGGGREVLIDMIRDFAKTIRKQGHEVVLDVWPTMTHVFHMHGLTLLESRQAFERLLEIINTKVNKNEKMTTCPQTET